MGQQCLSSLPHYHNQQIWQISLFNEVVSAAKPGILLRLVNVVIASWPHLRYISTTRGIQNQRWERRRRRVECSISAKRWVRERRLVRRGGWRGGDAVRLNRYVRFLKAECGDGIDDKL